MSIVLPAAVYLDNSVLSRLTDSATPLSAEIELVRRIVAACVAGRLRLVTSDILDAEIRNAPARVQVASRSVLAYATTRVELSDVFRSARGLGRLAMDPVDALHLAAAIAGNARYAVSCDEDWLRRAARFEAPVGPIPAIVAPAKLVRREGL